MKPLRAFLVSFTIGLIGLFSAHGLVAGTFNEPLVSGTPAGPLPTA